MSRFLFFVLLLAALALGAHLWLSAQAQRPDLAGRELNPGEVKVVGVTPPAVAAKRAEDTRRAGGNRRGERPSRGDQQV
ncbi:MAG TPA: hypothetical protein VFP36_14025 [Usitatibacter sp.]|nr:hypothetical protein [Usitatibacter sp.]